MVCFVLGLSLRAETLRRPTTIRHILPVAEGGWEGRFCCSGSWLPPPAPPPPPPCAFQRQKNKPSCNSHHLSSSDTSPGQISLPGTRTETWDRFSSYLICSYIKEKNVKKGWCKRSYYRDPDFFFSPQVCGSGGRAKLQLSLF